MTSQTANRWLLVTTVVGGIAWIIAWVIYLRQPNLLSEIELLLFFGVAVTTPLALRLAAQPDRSGKLPLLYRITVYLHPAAVICVGLALWLPHGLPAAGFALVWQAQTGLLALYGLTRFLARPVFAVEEVCIDAGLAYVPVSGVWLIAYTAGFPLLTFDPTIILLTAVHFTFISLGGLVIAGMTGRRLYGAGAWPVYRVIAVLTVLSPALVAVGITFTQFAGRLWLEAGSVVVLAASFLMLALLYTSGGLPERRAARVLIVPSALALFVTMGFALAYSLGRFTGLWLVSIATMVQWHGWLNAVGFVFFGLLAWNMAVPNANLSAPGIPFSRLPWRWRIGPDFLQRISAVDDKPASMPTGIVDRLQDYESANFDPSTVLPTLVAFYEFTAAHELRVYPEWQPGFGLLSRIYKRISQRLGQMNFPTHPETRETLISSEILPLSDDLDGREQVRGWVRVYSETEQAVYVAAYAAHRYQGIHYMNIAFPLPLGNLTSILRLETAKVYHGGLLLTSFSERRGDQGVYFAFPASAVRLPINETIRVYSASSLYDSYPTNFAVGEIVAEHKMWLFGLHFLTLHYSIVRISTGEATTP